MIEISRKLNDNLHYVTDQIITDSFGQELKEVDFKCSEKLKKFISLINQLVVNKDLCRYMNNYMEEKENIVKDVFSSEFIWFWNIRKKIVKDILENNLKSLTEKNERTEISQHEFESDIKTFISALEFVVENNTVMNDIGNKETKNRNVDDKRTK